MNFQGEFENTTFNFYFPNAQECKAPFENTNSAVFKAGLRLVSMETKMADCPYHKKWMESREMGKLLTKKRENMCMNIHVWSKLPEYQQIRM